MLDAIKKKAKELKLEEVQGLEEPGTVELEVKAQSLSDSPLYKSPDLETKIKRGFRDAERSASRTWEDAKTRASDAAEDGTSWMDEMLNGSEEPEATLSNISKTMSRGFRDAKTGGSRLLEDAETAADDLYEDSPAMQVGNAELQKMLKEAGVTLEELLMQLKK